MIPAVLAALGSCKPCRIAMLAIGALLGAWLYLQHAEHEAAASARAAAVAEMERATAAEHDRRLEVEAYWQKWARGTSERINQMDKSNAGLQAKVSAAGAASRDRQCLDIDVVRQLGSVQRNPDRPQTGQRTR